ncbi:MAG: hypothetical protein R3E58_02995 [Phycisphaerae bacterium]
MKSDPCEGDSCGKTTMLAAGLLLLTTGCHRQIAVDAIRQCGCLKVRYVSATDLPCGLFGESA